MQATNFIWGFLLLFSMNVVHSKICSDPEHYKGKVLCYPAGEYCGQCVSFYKVCSGDSRVTQDWKRGVKVRGAPVPKGAGIATFPRGEDYGHAAIYVGQNSEGIQVWDQWVGHPVSTRTIRWDGAELPNNGNSFYVIN